MQPKEPLPLSINRADADCMRGLAMGVIMLHNYFHILEYAPGENEFSFSLAITQRFVSNLAAWPADVLRQSFSFWGHYAVQLFIFLSGYGLAVRYGGKKLPPYLAFIRRRLRKLYPVLLLAVLGLFCYKALVYWLFDAQEISLVTYAKEALLKLSLLANLVPGQALSLTGPWWFFSLIFQLYLLTPFLLRIRQKRVLLGLIAASWLLQWGVLFWAPDHIAYVRYNFAGHLPEFCLGILLASYREKPFHWGWLWLGLPLFLLGSFNAYVWVTSFFWAPLLGLGIYRLIAPSRQSQLSRLLRFWGRNSLYFFAVHSLCRPPFVVLGNKSLLWSWAAALLYLLVVTGVAIAFKQLLYFLMEFVEKRNMPADVRPPS